MPLTYLPPINYPSPMIPIPSKVQPNPIEGRFQVPIEILWASMGGANKVVGFDLRESAPGETLQQIASLIVDNSACSVAITITFPDTGEQMILPALAKRIAVNVFTNGLNMIVTGTGGAGTDVTRMQLLNYRIPSIVIL